MVETHDHFVNRLNTLGRKHAKMTHGYTTKVGKDGLIVVKPKRTRRAPRSGGLKLIFLVAIGFIGFKAFTLATVGPVTYNERLSTLQNGTIIEQAGAKAMAIDPVTEAVAGSVGKIVR